MADNLLNQIQERLYNYFDQVYPEVKIQELIVLSQERNVDLVSAINNTYEYHERVKKIDHVIPFIKRTLTNGIVPLSNPKKEIELEKEVVRYRDFEYPKVTYVPTNAYPYEIVTREELERLKNKAIETAKEEVKEEVPYLEPEESKPYRDAIREMLGIPKP